MATNVSIPQSVPYGFTADGDVNHSEVLFCNDPTCPDRLDDERITQLDQWYTDGLITLSDAERLYQGRNV